MKLKFTSLEQRMAQSYIDMFPKFVPDEKARIFLDIRIVGQVSMMNL